MGKKNVESSFETFSPRDYLEQYYSKIGAENDSLLEFFAQIYKTIDRSSVLLEFGGGPTLYSLISAAEKVKEIHFSDYLDVNLDEIRLWQESSTNAFNWSLFFKRALEFEGKKDLSDQAIKRRENLLRSKLKEFFRCNAFHNIPIHENPLFAYDIVSVNFVSESITSSKSIWKDVMTNICSVLKKDGILVMTALKKANYYRVGNKMFPAVLLTDKDIKEMLEELGFVDIASRSVPAEVIKKSSPDYEGYKGFIFVKAKKE